MNNRTWKTIGLLATVWFLAACFAAVGGEVPRMSTETLRDRLGEDRVAVLDVRSGSDWDKSVQKISGAERVDPYDVNSWIENYTTDQTIVLYCA
jgi:hypothetical protein